ncbi:right-handed parallel beta-helix repeat-containing protein [Halorubrum sp. SP3]|uniref:right-handed parallel beta-helix repeat-containing protein n=1 Tax=Halorubrum sp. SP3 TaxID=1537265 RepID=UPI0010F8C8CE|nr:right-handed parallel beta-helix repeat-containing protein [Halorubrum sp. SP3]TKX54897.1 right-handed parallel beta-helix repeat-containing protein [Halorubrum sp. SP3]
MNAGRDDDHRSESDDGSPDDDGSDRGDGSRGVGGGPGSCGRRPYLGVVGAAVASAAGCLGLGSDGAANAAPDDPGADDGPDGGSADEPDDGDLGTRHGIEFDRVLDAVDDLGLDPSGNDPVDDRLEDALSDGTLVRFPQGEYLLLGEVVIDADRVGVLGDGDARFVLPAGYTRLLFNYDPVPDDVLIENVDVDVRPDDTTTGIRLRCRNHFHIQDVEFLGRGTSESDGGTPSAFALAVNDEDGRGVLRDAVAKKGSRIDGYKEGNGRIGVWVGWSNKGTVRIEGCDFREFGNNGVYGSRTPGNVEIVDCYFLNNNATSARISGAGSYVENCTIEIDLSRYTGGAVDASDEFNTRAVVVEQGVQREGAPPLPAGAEIRDCTIRARSSPLSQSVVEQSPVARSLVVRDTEIRCDIDGTPAVRRGPVGALPYRPDRRRPPPPHWTELRNVTVDGDAAGGVAVDLRLAPGSAVIDCDIDCPGRDRDGVFLDHSPRSAVSGSEIRTDGHPIVVDADLTTPLDDHLLCLGVETVLERFGDDGSGVDLTAAVPFLRTLGRTAGTERICLGLGPAVPSLPDAESVSNSLRISVDALDGDVPIGRVLYRP